MHVTNTRVIPSQLEILRQLDLPHLFSALADCRTHNLTTKDLDSGLDKGATAFGSFLITDTRQGAIFSFDSFGERVYERPVAIHEE